MIITNFNQALRLCGLDINLATTELIIQVYLQVEEKEGDFCLKDAAKIIDNVTKQYPIDRNTNKEIVG